MSEIPDVRPYLHAIHQEYARWWEVYTVTDAEGRERRKVPEKQALETPASPFDFELRVQTVTRDERETPNPENSEESKEKIERLPVLEGLRKYAFDEKTRQLLLVGRPGSGKSTALVRLLLEEATLTPNPSPNFGRGEVKAIPVLVELRYWQTSITALMLDFFRRHRLNLSEAELENLLNANRVLVLIDGVNELPTEEARSQLEAFRRQYPRVPAIFTTRDLSLGGDVGIEKKLEMQPLTEAQMQEFVRAYLPECGEAMWRQLQGRVREFGKTPLLLWMLCEVVRQSPKAQLPSNLGGIFQVFTRSYEVSSVRKHQVAALKGDVRPLSDRRLWCKALKHLAEVMMRGEKPVDFRVVIERSEAERELEKLFEKEPSPPKTARDCLDDLLKYHLLQIKTGNEIEFRHQLIQEYYAAEALRERLPGLSDGELKREYLNYLKWTEPVALMLALVGEEVQAVRVVELALEVDWRLGARLAGEVRREWQEQTVGMVSGLDVPLWLKLELWGETRSDFAVPSLLQAIKHENSDVRGRAAEALGKLGLEAAIPGLLRLLEDEDSRVRWRAAEALGNLGDQQAIPGLLQALKDRDGWVRRSAAEALGNLSSEVAIPDLLLVFKDESSSVRWYVVEALGKLCSEAAISGLLQALEDRELSVRQSAVEGLGKLGSEVAIPGLLRVLKHKNYEVRWSAVEALGNLGSEAVIPGLLQALEDENSYVRWSAAEAFGKLGLKAVVMPGLLQALEHENSYVRWNAAEVLGILGSEAAIPVLLQALEHTDPYMRWSPAVVLGKMGSQKAIPGLLQSLEHENSSVRCWVVKVLGELGSQEAIPVLLQKLVDTDSSVRWSVAEVLGKLGSHETIPGLLQVLLQDEDSDVRKNAAEALKKLGLRFALSALLLALEDEDSSVRGNAKEALQTLRVQAEIPSVLDLLQAFKLTHSDVGGGVKRGLKTMNWEAAIPSLLRAFEHENFSVDGSLVKVLKNLNSEAAIPALLQALEDQNAFIRRSIAEALCQLNSEAAIPCLIRAIEDEDSEVRRKAVRGLGNLGSEAAIPALLQALKRKNSRGRWGVTEMLRNFKNDRAAHILPNLLTLIPTKSGKEAFRALTAIQANCKFYNYDIFRSSPIQKSSPNSTQPSNIYNIHNPEAVTIVEQNDGEVITKQISKAE